MTPIILASASPRRGELLKQVGIAYEACPVCIDETPRDAEPALDLVTRLAVEKATAAHESAAPERIILGADTVVVVDEVVLGKPRDQHHGDEYLKLLAGRDHEVLSAVALSFTAPSQPRKTATRVSRSRVWLREISAAERHAYWRSGEPADKAGGYAIQGLAAIFVSRLEGSYSGVMGLPLFETLALLRLAGVSPLAGS